MFDVEQQAIEAKIRDYCRNANLPDPGSIQWNPIPFSGEWGISTSFFQLAAQEGRQKQAAGGERVNVSQRAQEIASAVAASLGAPPGFARLEAVKGYLNLYFSSSEFARRVIEGVFQQGKDFGRGAFKGKMVMVEFSQPNTHKAFHVGHLRSAILGDVLARILEFAGFEVVRANYYGDIGLHVIKWLWNYMKHHAGEKPTQDITRWMGDLYAEANQRLEDNPELEAEVRQVYARWDRRDPEVVNLWKETRQWSLDGFAEIYKILDIRFDRDYANSEAEEPGKRVVAELIERGIAIDERPQGPVIVRIDDLLGLQKEKYRVLVILRSDNTALYSTEDLALAVIKFNEYPLDESIYVVDVRQSLHFQQVFKTLEIAGYPWAGRCIHLAYEIVNLPGNVVMASREGTVVLLETLIREAIQRAYEVVQEKNPDLEDTRKAEVARAVGLGALKYPMLSRDHAKVVTFDWESALDFEGQAAPYIQYAHVRANSILRRVGETPQASVTTPAVLEPVEVQLIDLISRFPNEVQRAAAEKKTLVITNLAYELARAFNDFYNQCPVIKAEPEIRRFRLGLVAASRQAIANALELLGIHAPEVM
ncbi:MAG: arginine--tRNA ligase [Chloroflexota bacterium]|nr:MAG: arginine--tRNA ligase [Chloroflexota bacterium]